MAKQKKNELPILMCGDMIRAYMDGRKTKTRRIVKPQPVTDGKAWACYWEKANMEGQYGPSAWGLNEIPCESMLLHCPYGKVGDKLWFRESILYSKEHDNFYYAADKKGLGNEFWSGRKKKSVPSIFMPRAASRFNPKILSIKVERVQDITVDDVWEEGIQIPCTKDGGIIVQISGKIKPADYVPNGFFARDRKWTDADKELFTKSHYAALFDTINGKGTWDKNPWVWVIEFERYKPL